MSVLRFIWRLLRVLVHAGRGVWISVRSRVSQHDLPDPEIISRWMQRFLHILGVKVERHGQPPDFTAMIVANHLSWLDILVIGSCTHASFLSKESIRRWPLIGWFAISAGTIFIRRGKGESSQVARAMAQHLDGNRQLAIFPEGRVTSSDQVERFFPRLFAAAIEAEVPIVPVALRYVKDGKIDEGVSYTPGRSFIGILLRIMVRPSSHAIIIFCDPIPVQGKDRRSLADESRQAIQSALESLEARQI